MRMNEPRRTGVAIVGAGPAGMAAAVRLAEAGQRPVVFDLSGAPGGQIYHQLGTPMVGAELMGADYVRGRELLARFASADIDYRPFSRVWWGQRVAEGTSLGVLERGRMEQWRVGRLLLATGAMERGWPFPGWQLPGVMNAGAAQILLKQGGMVPESSPVLAGCGPLLYLLAWQYLRAGRPPRLILDLAPASRYGWPLRQPLRAWRGRGHLLKGLNMILALRRAGVPIRHGVDGLTAEGGATVSHVAYRLAGKWHRVPTGLLLVHFGVVPEPQLARALGLPHHWHAGQQGFLPERDGHLLSGDGLWIAGDGGGIGGAENAECEGRLAAVSMLMSEAGSRSDMSRLSAEHEALRRCRSRCLAARSLLDGMFEPPERWLERQPDDALVCRCENVTLAELHRAIDHGASGPNQLKAFTRCGMGPCQGRQCGESVTRLLSQRLARPPERVGYYQIRPPVHSITLGELAGSDVPGGPT